MAGRDLAGSVVSLIGPSQGEAEKSGLDVRQNPGSRAGPGGCARTRRTSSLLW